MALRWHVGTLARWHVSTPIVLRLCPFAPLRSNKRVRLTPRHLAPRRPHVGHGSGVPAAMTGTSRRAGSRRRAPEGRATSSPHTSPLHPRPPPAVYVGQTRPARPRPGGTRSVALRRPPAIEYIPEDQEGPLTAEEVALMLREQYKG